MWVWGGAEGESDLCGAGAGSEHSDERLDASRRGDRRHIVLRVTGELAEHNCRQVLRLLTCPVLVDAPLDNGRRRWASRRSPLLHATLDLPR